MSQRENGVSVVFDETDSDSVLASHVSTTARPQMYRAFLKDTSYVSPETDYIVTCTNETRIPWFVTYTRSRSRPTSVDSIPSGFRIGFITSGATKQQGHLKICNALLRACGVDPDELVVVYITDGLAALKTQQVDALFVCCNDEELKPLRYDHNVSCLDYGICDKDMVRVMLPYATPNVVPLKEWFTNAVFQPHDVFRWVLSFDCVVTCPITDCAVNEMFVMYMLRRYAKSLRNKTARLARFFFMHPLTERVLQDTMLSRVRHVVPRTASMDVLDGAMKVNDLVGDWLKSRWGYYDVYISDNFDTLSPQLKAGETFVKMPEEITMYVLTRSISATAVPISESLPGRRWMDSYLSTRDGSGTVVTVASIDTPISLRSGMKIAWFKDDDRTSASVPLTGTISRVDGDQLTLTLPPQPDVILSRTHDNRTPYVCLGHPDVSSNAECEATGGVWDRPCGDSSECPFYLVNRADTKGGCDGGYCQMPVGVKRAGWRRYYDTATSFPICHGCEEVTPLCCKRVAFPES